MRMLSIPALPRISILPRTLTHSAPARLIPPSESLLHPRSLFSLHRPRPSSPPRGSARAFMPTFPSLASLFSTSVPTMTYPVSKSTDEWRAVLSKEQFRILREKGTEAPYTGAYDQHMPARGVYACAACSAPLYAATHKFKSGCGWPAYFDSIPGAVTRRSDNAFGMARTEIVCSKCGGHLGHVFKGEGYPTPTDERHCVNSISLTFEAEGDGKGKV